jgi:hypothetical protein
MPLLLQVSDVNAKEADQSTSKLFGKKRELVHLSVSIRGSIIEGLAWTAGFGRSNMIEFVGTLSPVSLSKPPFSRDAGRTLEDMSTLLDRVADTQWENTCAVWTISLVLKWPDDDVLRKVASDADFVKGYVADSHEDWLPMSLY